MKAALTLLSSKLLKFHRDLLMFQAGLAEKEDGRKYTPYELLGLSLNDPRFDWLRRFSELIIQIDTALDDKENKSINATAFYYEALKLTSGDDEGTHAHFKLAVESNPAIAEKQAEVRTALSLLKPFLQTL